MYTFQSVILKCVLNQVLATYQISFTVTQLLRHTVVSMLSWTYLRQKYKYVSGKVQNVFLFTVNLFCLSMCFV